jgi:hypothetical protein
VPKKNRKVNNSQTSSSITMNLEQEERIISLQERKLELKEKELKLEREKLEIFKLKQELGFNE